MTRLLAALRRLVSRLRLRRAETADDGYMADLEITPEDTPTYRAWRDNPPAEAANSAEWGQDLGSFVLRWYWQPHPKTSAAYAAGMGRAAERLASPPRYVDAEDVLGPLDPPRG